MSGVGFMHTRIIISVSYIKNGLVFLPVVTIESAVVMADDGGDVDWMFPGIVVVSSSLTLFTLKTVIRKL